MRHGQCHAIGCSAWGLNNRAFCDKHAAMVESDTLRVLERKYRPHAKKPSAIFSRTLATALKEILFHQTNGHRRPADRAFEWTDSTEVNRGPK